MLREVSAERGIDFVHVTGREGTYFFPEIMIGGGAFLDYDQDGDLDVYLVNGNYKYDGKEGPGRCRLRTACIGRKPDGHFVEVTAESGLGEKAMEWGRPSVTSTMTDFPTCT